MHPSCVVIDGDRVYVSHIGPEYRPGDKNGAGYIIAYDANGRLVDTLIKRLNSPLGMAAVGDVLYFTNVDQVVGVDKATGRVVASFLASEQHGLLGGLCADRSGHLYIADPIAGALWTIPIDGSAPTKVNTVFGVSDLAYDPSTDKLYASSYLSDETKSAYVYELDPSTGKSRRVVEYAGNLGAVEVVGNRLLYTALGGAKAPGVVFAVDPASGQVSTLVEGTPYSGLGPFATLSDGLAFMPTIYGDEVRIVRLP